MTEYLEKFLKAMRPAFSREATFVWFVVVFAGFVVRSDTLGVSSIVRALWLAPACYPCLLHFFHSTAWQGETLLKYWRQWLMKENVAYRIGEWIVLVGDHTKNVKDGRRIPAVSTLHQDSETCSKPSFFRGHHWGCIGLLVRVGRKFFATPLWAEIHQDLLQQSRTTYIVTIAAGIAQTMGCPAYLVLDAYFAVGPVFKIAAGYPGRLHILTRAKKNVVAYLPPTKPKKLRPGRPRKYGEKLKLATLFDAWDDKFETVHTEIYHKYENVRYLTLNLFWKPTQGMLRFILIESSRGRIILMTSNLNLNPLIAPELYSRRVTIETLFDTLKNILGGMNYHFWSKYLKPASRRPVKKNMLKSTSSQPQKTQNTLAAIEKFLHIQLLVLGTLQLLACRFPLEIGNKARCWLRTPCGKIPSEFVTRTALSNIIQANLFVFAKDWITQLILQKQNIPDNTGHSKKAA